MTWIDWIILAAYLGSLIGLGFFLARRQEDESSYFLGGRRMPGWAVTVSIVATSLSAGTFVGVPQVAYRKDLTFLMLPMGSALGGILAAILLIRTLYRANTLTIYGYLRERLGPRAELAASWVFLVGVLLAQGARHFIASIVVALMLFGSSDMTYLILAIVILGIIATVYTAMGGIHAVIWTDVVQVVVLTFSAGICVIFLVGQIPFGPGEIVEALKTAPEGNKLKWWNSGFDMSDAYTAWAAIGAYALMNIAQYGCDQDMAQRMMTCKSEKSAMWSMIYSRLVQLPILFLFLMVGLLLYLYYARPDLMGLSAPADVIEDTKNVFPQYILTHLPPGIVGVAVAGMLAASMSSFDSAANAMASTVRGNLVRRKEMAGTVTTIEEKALALLESRKTVYYMGGGLTLFAILAAFLQEAGGQGLIDFSLGVLTFAYSGLFGVFMTAVLTKRGNERSAIAALATGAITVLLFQPYVSEFWSPLFFEEGLRIAWPWWMAIAGGLSFLVCWSGKPKAKAG